MHRPMIMMMMMT